MTKLFRNISVISPLSAFPTYYLGTVGLGCWLGHIHPIYQRI